MKGEQLRYIRHALNLSQVELAALIGIEATAVRRFENGRQKLRLRTLRKMQQVLKYDELDLLEISELLADENASERQHASLKKKLRTQAAL